MGYVYLLIQLDYNNKETFKIGFTKNNPEKRVKQLNTGNPNKIELLNYFESRYYINIENWLHKKYIEYNYFSEWFELPNNIVKNFILDCKEAEKNIEFLSNENYFYK
jgi:hypothetical protein